jgi:hypothetical protein
MEHGRPEGNSRNRGEILTATLHPTEAQYIVGVLRFREVETTYMEHDRFRQVL